MCKAILGQELRWTGRRRLQYKRRQYSSNCRFQDQRRKRWCKLNIIFWASKLYKQTHRFFRNTVTVSATSASMAKCNGLTTIMGEIFALPITNNMFCSEHNYTPFITFGWRNVFPHPHSIKKFLLWHRGLKNCLGEHKKRESTKRTPPARLVTSLQVLWWMLVIPKLKRKMSSSSSVRGIWQFLQ